jgi:hypothetical protein
METMCFMRIYTPFLVIDGFFEFFVMWKISESSYKM